MTDTESLWRREPVAAAQAGQGELPVLASTQLCLELLVQQNSLDLGVSADILSKDPGAVLRLFSRAAEDLPEGRARLPRLQDCIAALGVEKLMAVMREPVSSRTEQAFLFTRAQHAVAIARLSRVVASSLGLDEETAYLLGLLHNCGTRAAELSDPRGELCSARPRLAAPIARAHGMPAPLVQALEDAERGGQESVWLAVLDAAHDLATDNSMLPTCMQDPVDLPARFAEGAATQDSENSVRGA